MTTEKPSQARVEQRVQSEPVPTGEDQGQAEVAAKLQRHLDRGTIRNDDPAEEVAAETTPESEFDKKDETPATPPEKEVIDLRRPPAQ